MKITPVSARRPNSARGSSLRRRPPLSAAPVRPVDSSGPVGGRYFPSPSCDREQLVSASDGSLRRNCIRFDNCSRPSLSRGSEGCAPGGSKSGNSRERHQVVPESAGCLTRVICLCTSGAIHLRSKKHKLAKGRGLLERLKGHVPTGLQGRPQFSLRNRCSSSAAKSGWARGSPPKRHAAFWRASSCAGPSPAPPGSWRQALHRSGSSARPEQRGHDRQIGSGEARRGPHLNPALVATAAAPVGHAAVQARRLMHLAGRQLNSGSPCCDSGLAHHSHRSGRPLEKSGPACRGRREG